MPPISPMMNSLYGEPTAMQVYQRLQSLDPELNQLIQDVAYNLFWAREGLTTEQKSFVTVVSLLAQGKAEQIRIHVNGYLNSGGDARKILAVINYIGDQNMPDLSKIGLQQLNAVLLDRQQAQLVQGDVGLLQGLEATAMRLAFRSAINDLPNLDTEVRLFLQESGDMNFLRNLFIHQIVYCGFPTAMNAFGVISELKVE